MQDGPIRSNKGFDFSLSIRNSMSWVNFFNYIANKIKTNFRSWWNNEVCFYKMDLKSHQYCWFKLRIHLGYWWIMFEIDFQSDDRIFRCKLCLLIFTVMIALPWKLVHCSWGATRDLQWHSIHARRLKKKNK
jgi:hypothetical protein